MKNKLLKILALILSFMAVVCNSLSVFAYDIPVDENGNSVEKIEYKSSDDERFNGKTNVYAELASIYKVTIPKVVVLSGESKNARYFVKVEGDIAGYEQINVIPDENFLLYSKNKDSQTATINQDKIVWQVADFDTDANGTITAKDITAGKWQGTFNFNVNLSQVAGAIELPEHVQTEPVRENEIDATCTENGSYDEVIYCLDCDEELSRITKTVPKLGHVSGETIKTVIKEPTCTEKGSHKETTYCSRCGEVISERTISDYELGHEIVNGKCIRCGLASGFYGTKDGKEIYISWNDLVNKYGLNIEKDGVQANNWQEASKYTVQYIFNKYNLSGELMIDDSVKTIGSYNISRLASLTGITVGANTDLSKEASLRNLPNLEYINISVNNPYYISIEGVVFTKDMKTLVQYPAKKRNTSYTIPEGVITIKDRAFQRASYLEVLTLPKSLEEIGRNALQILSLKQYKVANGSQFIVKDNILFSKDMKTLISYPAQKQGASYSIPEGVEKLVMSSFFGNANLISISMPNSIKKSEENIFALPNLKSITYRGVTYTNKDTFNNKLVKDGIGKLVWVVYENTLS